MSQTVLVTGGAGYIGSHACKALSKSGFIPVTYDNLSRGHAWAVKWGPFEQGDICDASRLGEVISKHRPAAVMHFAAYCYVGESVSDPALYYQINLGGTLTLLETMRRAGINKLVFSSTCATYGIPQTIPIPESHQQDPANPYGASKLAVERMLKDFGAAYGIAWAALRYFNAAGADPECEIGEAHAPETHLIPLAIQATGAGRPPLTVFGTDYTTADGTAVRDYIHVADLGSAHLAALNYLLTGGLSLALNLGTGQGHSVREVISAVERSCGHKVPVRYGPRRPGDSPVLIADATKAAHTLGWRPDYPALETIVQSAWQWHRHQHAEGPGKLSGQA